MTNDTSNVFRLAALQDSDTELIEELAGLSALDYARRRGGTVYHPTSTCKMGSDPLAVVDAELRVHGIEGLRVADASIMPTVVSGNTNAACVMIGEKASDMILADASAKPAAKAA